MSEKIRDILYRSTLFSLFLLISHSSLTAQTNASAPHCENEDFDREVASYVDPAKVPLIDVSDLRKQQANFVILDAREQEEFRVSHLPGAFYAGYKEFDLKYLPDIDKSQPIAVYCSIGYRSEKISSILRDHGYLKVFNVYGSIFEWANRGYPLRDVEGKSTRTLHTYNEAWSRWITNPEINKIW